MWPEDQGDPPEMLKSVKDLLGGSATMAEMRFLTFMSEGSRSKFFLNAMI